MMDINVDLLQWFIRFLIKRLQMFLLNIKSLKIRNQLKNDTDQLLENLKNEKYTDLSQIIFDLADMQLISNFNIGISFILCVYDVFSIYVQVLPLKDKNVLQLLILFKKFQINLIGNLTKYGLIKAANFNNTLYSTHNEEKSVVVERFIRTLKNKICKQMISISKICILINQIIQQIYTVIHNIIQLNLIILGVKSAPVVYFSLSFL